MKYKILSIVITLPIVILLSVLLMAHTQNVSDSCIRSVQQIEQYARSQQWERARQALADLAVEWEAKKPLLRLWVVHNDADNVTRYIRETQVGIALRDESVLYVGITNLIESLDHLRHKDDLNISNIL